MADESKLFSDKADWNPDDVAIVKMDETPRGDFDCGREEQNEYFLKFAEHNQSIGIAVTYLMFFKGEQCGFVTLTMDEIPLNMKERPKEVIFPRLPALKLAQMGVHKSFAGQGLGTALVLFTINTAVELAEHVGCRYVTLDAKQDREKWYAQRCFVVNKLDNKMRQEELEERIARAEKEGRKPPSNELPVSMRFDLKSL